MKVATSYLVAFCYLFCFCAYSGEPEAYTPPAGSSERKALMDVLRRPCEQDLKQPVVFKVEQLTVSGDWAFARVTPLQPNQKPIDYRQTKYKEAADQGAFDAMGEALLRRTNRTWNVVEWRFGATDTEVELWAEKYKLPKDLFR